MATQATNTMDDGTSASASDLVHSMRRLSVTSDTSSFSVVSAASSGPSVRSLDSNGSVAGGIQVEQSPVQGNVAVKQSAKSRAAAPPAIPATIVDVSVVGDRVKSEPKTATSATAVSCPFWYQFAGFEPSPIATFKDELGRLSKHQGWGTSQKRKWELEALRAEIAFHHGTGMHRLDQWRKLCEEMGIDEEFSSIRQCKLALKRIFVNLWNLVDHRRNPEIPIKFFKSHKQFRKSIYGGNHFPRKIAKQDGFINALLKVV